MRFNFEGAMPLPKRDSFEGVYDEFKAKLEAGEKATCPCCGRYAAAWSKPLNGAMARALIWCVRRCEQSDDGWANFPKDAPRDVLRTKQHTTLKHWKLIEPRWNDDRTTKASGIWRPTLLGKQWVARQVEVSEKAWIYNDTCVGLEPRTVTIDQALGETFNYERMMLDTFDGTLGATQ